MPTSIYLLGFVTLLAGSIVSGFLYFRKGKTYSKPVFYTLFVLRALAFALLFFVLIAPFIPIKSKEIIRPIVAVLVDNSSSMVLGKDSAEIKSSLFATLNQELSALENAETVFFSYDDLLRKGEPDFTGSGTDMANALNQVYN